MNFVMNTLSTDSTIQQLRTLGWTVRCTYYRYRSVFPFGLAAVHDMKWSAPLVPRPRPLVQDVHNVTWKRIRRVFREEPLAKGGKVEISLTPPDNWDGLPMATAEAVCSVKDQFVKKTGRDLALRRCIDKVNIIIEGKI